MEKGRRRKGRGRRSDMPERGGQAREGTGRATRHCKNLTLLLALNYGGRSEIADACKAIAYAHPGDDQELCADGFDNDCDGFVDCADTGSCPNGSECASCPGYDPPDQKCECQAGACVDKP